MPINVGGLGGGGGSSSGSGHQIQDEGSALTQRSAINFVGSGVSAADAGGKTVVTISGTGRANGFAYTWQTNTAATDPGTGKIKGNNATVASITALYISETDADANALAAEIATWDDSTTTTARGKLKIFVTTDATKFLIFNITGANTDNGTYDTLVVTYVTGGGTIANGDGVTVLFVPTGDKGATGAAGADGAAGSNGAAGSTGATGAAGQPAGYGYTWNTTTTAGNPGSGSIRANNATFASITEFYVNPTNDQSQNVGTDILTWDDSTSTTKGRLKIYKRSTPTSYILCDLTSATDNTTYITLVVTILASSGSFSSSDSLAVLFLPKGDAGNDGTLTGTQDYIVTMDSGGNAQVVSPTAVRGTMGLATSDSPQFTAVNIGHATDTTVARVSAGVLSVEGVNILTTSAALGTPASGTLTNCTGLPVAGITASTSTALGVGSVELGHATDTSITRVSAGVIAVEGNTVLTKDLAPAAFVYEDIAPADETRTVCLRAPFACTIASLTHQLTSGTLTANVKINGTSITGLSAVSVTSSKTTTNATAANTVAVGDVITVVITSSSTPVGLAFTLNATRT